jgi:glycosyltransferase involved in cell wall biosynthesis
MQEPCISVIVTNFNYGRFLDRCLSSVLDQNYRNLEVIICDNHSTDESLSVIQKYLASDPDRITLVRQRSNLGSAANFKLGHQLHRGELFINLGADDYLQPDCLSTVVQLFKAHPNASQVVCHADSVDELGVVSQRKPFFDGSYLIPGRSYAPILMLAGITAHTSQTFYCSAKDQKISLSLDYIGSQTIGERTMAMMHAVHHDVIYIDRPLVVCRDSVYNETFKLNSDLSQIIEQWSVIQAFDRYAKRHGLKDISDRKDEAIAKLAQLCERYAVEFKRLGQDEIAGRYLGLQMLLEGTFDRLFSSEISENPDIISTRIQACVQSVCNKQDQSTLVRKHSYPPPADSVKLYFENS